MRAWYHEGPLHTTGTGSPRTVLSALLDDQGPTQEEWPLAGSANTAGDGVAFSNERDVKVVAGERAEILLFDLA